MSRAPVRLLDRIGTVQLTPALVRRSRWYFGLRLVAFLAGLAGAASYRTWRDDPALVDYGAGVLLVLVAVALFVSQGVVLLLSLRLRLHPEAVKALVLPGGLAFAAAGQGRISDDLALRLVPLLVGGFFAIFAWGALVGLTRRTMGTLVVDSLDAWRETMTDADRTAERAQLKRRVILAVGLWLVAIVAALAGIGGVAGRAAAVYAVFGWVLPAAYLAGHWVRYRS